MLVEYCLFSQCTQKLRNQNLTVERQIKMLQVNRVLFNSKTFIYLATVVKDQSEILDDP